MLLCGSKFKIMEKGGELKYLDVINLLPDTN
jgi:hypothetical protein